MNLPLVGQRLLWPLSVIYGEVVRIRVWLYAKGVLEQKRLNVPVISIGNLTLGGTGKTPMVIWLAEHFLAQGKRIGILTRGYKGSGGTSDEVELMKLRLGNQVFFGVGPDRYEQGRRLQGQGVDIFLLDDGYQHLRLARNVNILLIDGSASLKDQRLLPAGRLREPIREIGRADMIVVTRKSQPVNLGVQGPHAYNIFYAQTQLLGFRRFGQSNEEKLLTELGLGPFFAFCGIATPSQFLKDLEHWNVRVCGSMFYPDHHRYTQADLNNLEKCAQKAKATGFVTTEKDWMNFPSAGVPNLPTYIAVISLSIHSQAEFEAALCGKLQKTRSVA